MDRIETVRNQFLTITKLAEEEIDLIDAALVIARTAYPRLDEAVYRGYLQDLTDRLRSRLEMEERPLAMIEKLNRIVFAEEHFQGNRSNYFDADNSFINRVIDRKLGIPITLSMIYNRVGREAGLDLCGIPLPGHFISALSYESGKIFIDPFNNGEILSEEECRIMVRGRLGENEAFDTRRLLPASPKEILLRMLRNLKAIYLYGDNDMKAFEILHWILALDPDAAKELRERGTIYEALGNTDRAVKDYKRYLELSPDRESEQVIGSKIETLKGQTTWIH